MSELSGSERDPKDTPIWDYFEDWCLANDISLDHEDDWIQWWDCWYDGFSKATAILYVAEKDSEKTQPDENP